MQSDTNLIITKIRKLTSSYDFIEIITKIILDDLCLTISREGTLEKENNENNKLNLNEVSYLIGTWVRNANKRVELINDQISIASQIRELMEKLHNDYIFNFPRDFHSKSFFELMFNENVLIEAFFYSSNGAYDFQFIDRIESKYKYDTDWLIKNKNILPHQLKSFFINIKQKIQKKINDKNCKITNPFILSFEEIIEGDSSFERILNEFKLKMNENHNLHYPTDINLFYSNPIVELKNNEYFVPLTFNLAEAIYNIPFKWMQEDQIYKNIASNNKGRIAEEISYDLFAKVFGSENVFKGVNIYQSKSTTITEIDTLILYNKHAICIQVKSKTLTNLSKSGDLESIKNDFEKAVEHSYLQGQKSATCILNKNAFKYIDCNNQDLSSRIGGINNVNFISVLLDTFPSVSMISSLIFSTKYKTNSICFTLFDLEVLCHFLDTPEKFYDYLIKRIKTSPQYISENELVYLSFYLKHDLHNHTNFNGVSIDSIYGKEIDELYFNNPDINKYLILN